MSRRDWAIGFAWCAAWAAAAGGCAASSNSSGAFSTGGGSNAAAPGTAGGGNGFGGAISDGGSALPPEMKVESAFRSPVATGQVVWIANPVSGRVAYIDATTFVVKTVQAGNGPTYLAAVPDGTNNMATPNDKAIVLNVLSQDATLLELRQGVLATRTFPATANANAWAVSKSGRWAIAWTDTTAVVSADPTQGFQDVMVLDLSTVNGARPPTTLAVGFRPVQVAFEGDAHAFVVSQDGISVIDLLDGARPSLVANYALPAAAPAMPPDAAASDAAVSDSAPSADAFAGDASADGGGPSGDGAVGSPLAADSAAPPTSVVPDVSFTPDGTYALVRQDGLASIAVVSLADGTTTTVALPALPTDLTMSPTGDFAVAVMRDTSTVAILPVPGIASAPTSFSTVNIAGETVGRAIITDQGQTALLFTTAAPVERMTVLTLGTSPSYRTIPLHAPVLAVFPSADARSAIVLHNLAAPTAGVKGAFSVVPIATTLPAHIVSLAAPPTAVAVSPNGDRALVAMRDDLSATYGVYLANTSSLEAVPYPLASPPIAVGIVAGAATGYAAQDYSEGRITFLDLEGDGGSATARTITGFELGARVVEGSAQP